MAAYIRMEDGFEFPWHVGTKLEIWQISDEKRKELVWDGKPVPYRKVVELYADGDELAKILDSFSGIIKPTNESVRSFTWVAEMAHTIAVNLK